VRTLPAPYIFVRTPWGGQSAVIRAFTPVFDGLIRAFTPVFDGLIRAFTPVFDGPMALLVPVCR
jgi:hypothetical protein